MGRRGGGPRRALNRQSQWALSYRPPHRPGEPPPPTTSARFKGLQSRPVRARCSRRNLGPWSDRSDRRRRWRGNNSKSKDIPVIPPPDPRLCSRELDHLRGGRQAINRHTNPRGDGGGAAFVGRVLCAPASGPLLWPSPEGIQSMASAKQPYESMWGRRPPLSRLWPANMAKLLLWCAANLQLSLADTSDGDSGVQGQPYRGCVGPSQCDCRVPLGRAEMSVCKNRAV